KKAYPQMFISYMTLAQATLQWGNRSNWNANNNKDCCGGVSRRRTREVDMVDILERNQQEIVFCDCTLDQVRLIRMDNIGGSPVHPETAYSIRLLQLHHSLWKYCTVQTQGFTLALDECLDPADPLILTNPIRQPRRWQKTFSSAIDAYRHMLQKEKDLALCALSLTPLDQLAMNCPRCFGPLQPNEDPDECDYRFCADGNFQHR
ncbi:hypothetical protein DFH28DRAFT_823459, partial [Melampsora americana]